jgi:hypothetical protein
LSASAANTRRPPRQRRQPRQRPRSPSWAVRQKKPPQRRRLFPVR